MGLPPTTTKGSGDSTPVTTFEIDAPNQPITHSGTKATLGTLTIAGGGTGQVTKAAAFDALSPMSASGDIVIGGASGTGTRLPKGTDGQLLALSSGSPVWASNGSVFPPTTQVFTATGTTTGYLFTISTSSTVAVGDTYTNNGNTYTVLGALSAQTGQVLFTSGASAPLASGTLARATGSGTSSITFSANVALGTYTAPTSPAPLYLHIVAVGGGGGGGTSNTGNRGGSGTGTFFGPNIIVCNGGTGGLRGVNDATGGTASKGAASGIAVQGGSGLVNPVDVGTNSGGAGASSGFFGGAGVPGAPGSNTGGSAIANTGSGGGGASTNNTANGGTGGGAGGYVNANITSVAVTYPYIIGTGGAGGTGGDANGGAGAAGTIIVWEHYQ